MAITSRTDKFQPASAEIDYHPDVPTKPGSGNQILELQDGILYWVDSTTYLDHIHDHDHPHDLDDHTDVPTKPSSGNQVLENQDGTLVWIDSTAIHEHELEDHNLDFHTDVPPKPNDGKEYILIEENDSLAWIDATSYIAHVHDPTLEVQDEGISIDSAVDTINFKGNVDVSQTSPGSDRERLGLY